MEPSDLDKQEAQRLRPLSVNDATTIGDVARAQGQKPEVNLTNTTVSPNGVLSEAQAGVRPLENPPTEETEPVGTALVEGAADQVHEQKIVDAVKDAAQKVMEDEKNVSSHAQLVLASLTMALKLVDNGLKLQTTKELETVKEKLQEAEKFAKQHLQSVQK